MAKVSVSVMGTDGSIAVEIEDKDRCAEELIEQLAAVLYRVDPQTFPKPAETNMHDR